MLSQKLNENEERYSLFNGSNLDEAFNEKDDLYSATDGSDNYSRDKYNKVYNSHQKRIEYTYPGENPYFSDNHSTSSKRRKVDHSYTSNENNLPIPIDELQEIIKEKTIHQQERKLFKVQDDSCWGCRQLILTPDLNSSGIDGYAKFAQFIQKNLYKMTVDELCVQLRIIYDRELKKQVAEKQDREPEEWTEAQIKHHLKDCVRDPSISTRFKIDMFENILTTIANQAVTASPTSSKMEIDEKAIKSLGLLSSVIKDLYSQKVEISPAFSMGVTTISDLKKEKFNHLSHLNRPNN